MAIGSTRSRIFSRQPFSSRFPRLNATSTATNGLINAAQRVPSINRGEGILGPKADDFSFEKDPYLQRAEKIEFDLPGLTLPPGVKLRTVETLMPFSEKHSGLQPDPVGPKAGRSVLENEVKGQEGERLKIQLRNYLKTLNTRQLVVLKKSIDRTKRIGKFQQEPISSAFSEDAIEKETRDIQDILDQRPAGLPRTPINKFLEDQIVDNLTFVEVGT